MVKVNLRQLKTDRQAALLQQDHCNLLSTVHTEHQPLPLKCHLHTARLQQQTPAPMAFQYHINLTFSHERKRSPSQPFCMWISQVQKDHNDTEPADLGKNVTECGHSRMMTSSKCCKVMSFLQQLLLSMQTFFFLNPWVVTFWGHSGFAGVTNKLAA